MSGGAYSSASEEKPMHKYIDNKLLHQIFHGENFTIASYFILDKHIIKDVESTGLKLPITY